MDALNGFSHRLKRSLPWLAMDALRLRSSSREIMLAVGFSFWKEAFIQQFFKSQTVLFVDTAMGIKAVRYLLSDKIQSCAIWSFRDEELGLVPSIFAGLTVKRIEDGFIRSLGRGIDHELPWSLCLDGAGMYFDASKPSDFERLCNGFEEAAFVDRQAEAAEAMKLLLQLSISKYNPRSKTSPPHSPSYSQGAVLVLGQVEDDRSITRNQTTISTNSQLIARAVAEHPGKPIYFKQHPDCLGERRRPGYVDLNTNEQVIELAPGATIADAIKAVDTIYTISSLGGFEALLRGKQVVTFGCPFYAGWGLTTDHVSFPRRKHRLTTLQLFYVSYILYPTYFNPHDGRRMNLEELIRKFAKELI